MELQDRNWMHVEEYLRGDDRLMLVTGACEQHGYLSLLTDARIPLALAAEAGRRTGVLVAPPLCFGISPGFLSYPGTISLRTHTFLSVVEDLVRCAYGQGFRRLLFVNGHGGNEPARQLLVELANDLADLRVSWYSWWLSPSVVAIADSAGLAAPSYHGAWLEAFPFCRVVDLPKTGKERPQLPLRTMNSREYRDRLGDGVMGSPYVAGDDTTETVFAAAVADVVARLDFDP
jgi:creatinine amidohydrolase